ncbi:hypothetical protein Stube_67720 [Streptomyces tubercidicus]|uniref:Uncharacterized protein n=1 Tax=Streptomyces tubercidicus TaxID=47759 RepID=A0A640V1P1_9ACTN|nr:hypothetical protein Stube_67720 [Streptomyces tubercidicus]
MKPGAQSVTSRTADSGIQSAFHQGTRPTGPAWYATPTVAYAVELGASVQPAEAYVRYEHGAYLDAWYTRLRDAYMATMADLGVTTGMPDDAFLAAMARHKDLDRDRPPYCRPSSRPSRAASASSVSGRRASASSTVSGGLPWSGRPEARTSGRN